MERKKLKLDSDNTFDKYKDDNLNKITKNTIDKEKIERVAIEQGFTKREQDSRGKTSYTGQFNVKCKKDLNELVTDILYQQKKNKLKKH